LEKSCSEALLETKETADNIWMTLTGLAGFYLETPFFGVWFFQNRKIKFSILAGLYTC
jgi:hypothetical protein